MGFFLVGNIVLVIGCLATAVSGQAVETCFISDFNAGEVIIFADDTIRSNLMVAIGNDGTAVSDFFSLGESPEDPQMTDNFVKSCDKFRICTAHIGLLFDSELREKILDGSSMGLLVKVEAQQDPTECPINGLNVAVPPEVLGTVLPVSSDSSMAQLGGLSISTTTEVISITQLVSESDSSLTVGVNFGFKDGVNVDLVSTGNDGESSTFDAKEVVSVLVLVETANTNQLCGLILQDEDDVYVGGFNECSGSLELTRFDIPDTFRLLAFAVYSLNPGFTFLPLMYQRLSPQVLFYERKNEQLVFYVKSFFTAPEAVTYDYSYVIGMTTGGELTRTEVVNQALGTLSSNPASSQAFLIDPSDTSCGCYPVNIDIITSIDTNIDDYKYLEAGTFTAWTVGFTNDESLAVTYGSLVSGASLDSSGSIYVMYSVSEDDDTSKCPEMYPRKLATGRSNEMWVDGWLGPNPADELIPTQTLDIDAPITRIYLHAGSTLTGMTFTTATSSNFSTGDTSNDIPIDGILEALSDNHYLMYLTTTLSTKTGSVGSVIGITAIFGRPKPPCFVMTEPGESYTSDLLNGDMQKVYWYAPVDFNKVDASIMGKFVAENDESLQAVVMPVGTEEFDRGQVYFAYLYQLKPNQEYNFTLTGTVEPTSDYLMVTLPSDEETFTTGDGLYLECTNTDPLTYTQKIDWSAIPEVEIEYEDSDLTSFGGAEDHSADAKGVQQFPTNTYFHYLDGQIPNHPAFIEFRGYPKAIYLYRVDGEECVKALALEYNFQTGTETVFLSGNAVDAATLTDDVEIHEFSGAVNVVSYDTHSSSGSCLNSIRFQGPDGDSGCLAGNTDVGDCTVDVTAPTGSFYMSSLSIRSDNDSYITALGVTWASAEIPTLQSNEATCNLSLTEDFFDIRRSHWELTYNLEANSTTCGAMYSAETNDGVHRLVYNQIVRRSRDSAAEVINGEGGAQIIRSSTWEVTTECSYDVDGQVSSSFATMGEEAKKAIDIDDIEFSMHLYKDETFSEKYNSAPVLNLEESVYIATELNNDLDRYILKNFECYATKSSSTEKNAYYSLSNSDGCPDDPSFAWDNLNDDHKDAFHFGAFGWVESGSFIVAEVHVHCTVRVCPTDSPSTSAICDARGTNCGNGRARRDVSKLLANGVREKTVTLDTPIFVKRRDVQTLSVNRDPVVIYNDRSMTVAILFGLFATVTFFCLLVIGYRVYSVRKRFYQIKYKA